MKTLLTSNAMKNAKFVITVEMVNVQIAGSIGIVADAFNNKRKTMKKTREKKAVIRDKVLSIRVSKPEYEGFLKKHKITGRDLSKTARPLILKGVKLKDNK